MQRVEERRAREAELAAQEAANKETFDNDLVPDQPFELTPEQQALDSFIDNLDIVDAYVKFTNYPRPRVLPGQVESIKAHCPNPSHKDAHESYWMNTQKNTGNCGVCGGMDVKDIAAYNFSYPVPEYKTNGDFPKLMRDIAESYGFHTEKTLAGDTVVWRETDTPPTDTQPESEPTPESEQKEDSNPSLETVPDNVEELFEAEIQLPTLDWETIVPKSDTFLDRYMEACRKDEAPEEYHFFNGLVALGFAAGRDVTLLSKMPVYGNLFICALGKSGAGKSTASKHLRTLLKRCVPYKHDDVASKGVMYSTPSSAETLIDSFSKPVVDPTNPKRIVHYAPVRGLIDFNELSGLIGRASRQGNLLKPIMMDFYDMNDEIRVQSRGSGTVIAYEPFASCTTTAQPAALRDLLRDSDDASGFLNRWLFVAGTGKQSTIMGTGPIDLDPSAEALEEVIGWTASFIGGKKIGWTADALAKMQSFFDSTIYPLKETPDTNIFVRMDLLYMKLVLLLSINKMESEVSLDTVESSIHMFAYLRACYAVPADQMGNTLENEMTEAIIYQMKRLGGKEGASLNAIAKALKRRKYSKELILRNIKALIELGFVEERAADPGAKGRPARRYAYVS